MMTVVCLSSAAACLPCQRPRRLKDRTFGWAERFPFRYPVPNDCSSVYKVRAAADEYQHETGHMKGGCHSLGSYLQTTPLAQMCNDT